MTGATIRDRRPLNEGAEMRGRAFACLGTVLRAYGYLSVDTRFSSRCRISGRYGPKAVNGRTVTVMKPGFVARRIGGKDDKNEEKSEPHGSSS